MAVVATVPKPLPAPALHKTTVAPAQLQNHTGVLLSPSPPPVEVEVAPAVPESVKIDDHDKQTSMVLVGVQDQDAMVVEGDGISTVVGGAVPLPCVVGDGEEEGGGGSGGVGTGGGVSGGDRGSACSRESGPAVDAFNDPVKALVQCLCGVVTSRWRQASSLEGTRMPQKAWMLHAMEAVHALTGILQVGSFYNGAGAKGGVDETRV